MKIANLLTLCCLLVAVAAAPSRGEEFVLYSPGPAAGDQVPASPDQGILVRKITVKRGDTLKNLSRKHIGVASWFPQVLLFNTIKHPDLIHPGDKLLIPVGKGMAKHAVRRTSRRHQPGVEHAAAETSKRTATETVKRPAAGTTHVTLGEQESYQQAKRAYLDGQYRKSLDLFEKFLHKFPNSNLAPDAALYKADSLLRLSGQ